MNELTPSQDLLRNKVVLFSTAMQTLVIFLLIGFVFFQIGNDQASVQNRTGVLFFVCINQVKSYWAPHNSQFCRCHTHIFFFT